MIVEFVFQVRNRPSSTRYVMRPTTLGRTSSCPRISREKRKINSLCFALHANAFLRRRFLFRWRAFDGAFRRVGRFVSFVLERPLGSVSSSYVFFSSRLHGSDFVGKLPDRARLPFWYLFVSNTCRNVHPFRRDVPLVRSISFSSWIPYVTQ